MNPHRLTIAAIIFLGGVASGAAREQPQRLTGNARIDFFPASTPTFLGAQTLGDSLQALIQDTSQLEPGSEEWKRSPWLAAGFSLVVPGGGELYTENYWKAVGFIGVETLAWVIAAVYDAKGRDQTDFFHDFANVHWSVVRYAQWMIQFQGASIPIDPNANLPPWERVNWDSLNLYERSAGVGFTHVLPKYGEQQYYELIGKYHQYSSGWDDYPPSQQDFRQISPRFSEYSEMRGKANDYYNIASTAVAVVVVNHVVSAIDAFFDAQRYNRAIQAEARMDVRRTPFGAFAEPKGILRVRF